MAIGLRTQFFHDSDKALVVPRNQRSVLIQAWFLRTGRQPANRLRGFPRARRPLGQIP